jgi:hypothetical protein
VTGTPQALGELRGQLTRMPTRLESGKVLGSFAEIAINFFAGA